MEPLNCTVHVTSNSCDVWVGTQIIARAQSVAAKAAGLSEEKVTIHQRLLGGGFGRRLEVDMIAAAVRIGNKVDGPVKIVWTREEDVVRGTAVVEPPKPRLTAVVAFLGRLRARDWYQFGQLPEVLGSCCEEELVMGTIWSS
jgi:CO/xanthine dehydrogenase Mo-binding subunit